MAERGASGAALPMTRIALFTPIFPYPLDTGIRIRIFHLARYLSCRHPIRILSLEPGDIPLATAALGAPVETLSGLIRDGKRERVGPFSVPRGIRERLWECVTRTGAEILHVEKSYGAAVLGLPTRPVPLPVVLDDACVHHIRYRREAKWAHSPWHRARALVRWFRLRRYESRLAAAVDAVLAVSAEEAAIIGAFAPETRVAVVPNGVDCDAIRPLPLGKDILFCGAFTYEPNRDAAMFFLREILPRLRAAGCLAEVLLVGAGPDPELHRLAEGDGSVQLPGWVPHMTPWYARAGVVINPMRGGTGTRLKVLEALAAGRPVVSTRIGAEGLEVSDGREVRLADDPASFAAEVFRLLRDQATAGAMGREGRLLVERNYDWKRCLAPLDTLYEELAAKGGTVPWRRGCGS